MAGYFIKRILAVLGTLLFVSLAAFLFLRLIPGDPARLIAGESASQETIQNVTHRLGLDQPLPVQYARWMAGVLHGDFGTSYKTHTPVAQEIAPRYRNTLRLAGWAILWSAVVGMLLGVSSAVHAGHWQDYAGVTLAVAGQAVPSFWIGMLLIVVFSVRLHWLPVSGGAGWKSMILPAFTMGTGFAATMTRFTRSSVMESLKEDYTRTARAKGLRRNTVVWKHVVRNSMNPVLTATGISLGDMLGGSVLIETVFAYPGLGSYLVNSIGIRDYVAVQAVILILSANYVVINLLVDFLQVLMNPEIRFE